MCNTALRVLSHLVRLPGPNPSSIAPPSPRWTAFILFYLGPNHGSFASSSQQLCTPLLSNDGTGEGGKMHKIALCTFIYLRFWTVRFIYKASDHKALTSVLRMYCKCSKERWRQTESSLLAARQSHCSGKWVKHTQVFIKSYVINSGSLPRFGLIAFTSAANRTGVHLNCTPDHPF